MKRKLIPFSWLPASWGLAGISRQIAEAEYYLEGKELDEKLIELTFEGAELELKRLELKKKYNDITETEYEKKRATLNDEPWVKILTTQYNPKDPLTGSFEIDWNEQFIKSLETQGYVAINDEEIVDLWLTELCKNVATEQYGGVGEFDDHAEEALDARKNANNNHKKK